MSAQLPSSVVRGPLRPSTRSILWALYTLFILYGSLAPFAFTHDWATAMRRLADLPLSPLISPDTGRRVSLPDVAQNLLFFFPFGALALGARERRPRARALIEVTLLAATLSAAVEFLQLLTADRVTSVSDVIADTLGALSGAVVAIGAAGTLPSRLRPLGRDMQLGDPAAFVAFAAASLVCLSAWVPFDVTVDVSTVLSHFRSLQVDPWHVDAWLGQGGSVGVVGATILGAAVLAWYRRTASQTALIAGSMLAVGVPLAAMAVQCLVGSRASNLTAPVVDISAAIAGALMAGAVRRDAWRRAAPIAAVLVILIVLAAHVGEGVVAVGIGSDRHDAAWLLRACRDNTFAVIWQAIGRGLLDAPAGYALACLLPFRRAVPAALVFGVVAEIVLESVRTTVGGCRVSTTIVAAGAAGAWIGAWVGTRGFDRWSAFFDAAEVA